MAPKKKGITMDVSEFIGDWAEEDSGPTKQWDHNSTDLFASVGMASSTPAEVQLPNAPPYTARVANLSYSALEDDISHFFRSQNIAQIRMPKGPDQRSKGYAFVEFADRNSLAAALGLDGTNLGGRSVRINLEQASEFGRGGPRRQYEDDNLDWGSRKVPQVTPREPRPGRAMFDEPELDWGARRAPSQAPRAREPREHREPRAPRGGFDEPDLDWGARRAPSNPPRNFSRGGNRREPRQERELDWNTRRAPAATSGPAAGAQASAEKKISKPSGFDVLKSDEATEPEPKETPSAAPAAAAPAEAPKMAETIAAATATATAHEDDSWTTVKKH